MCLCAKLCLISHNPNVRGGRSTRPLRAPSDGVSGGKRSDGWGGHHGGGRRDAGGRVPVGGRGGGEFGRDAESGVPAGQAGHRGVAPGERRQREPPQQGWEHAPPGGL